MPAQKWYNKATVQAALVNAIPTFFTAVIAIIAICVTLTASNRQFALEKQQYKRDSLNSKLQYELLQKQLDLTNRSFYTDSIINSQQLKIAEENLKILLKDIKTKNTAEWGKLRNTIWEIMDLTSTRTSREGYSALDKLSTDQKNQKSTQILNLLNSEIANPVLINNVRCLGFWRNAISKAKFLKDFNVDSITKYSDQISSLMGDVFFVWTELILNSNEASPTGGKPKLKN